MAKKLNQDSTAVENVLALYTFLLSTTKEYSLNQLAERFSVSKPTMLRYLQYLEKSEFGKILCEKRGREHFYVLERPRNLPKISLSPSGLQQLALCRDFMAHMLPEPMQKSIDTTLQQATAYMPSDSLEVMGTQFMDIGESFSKGKIDYTPFESMLKTLIQAISEQSVCTVLYQKRRNLKPESFDYAPQKLISYKDAIYIRGFMVTDKGAVEATHHRGTDLVLHRFKDAILTKRSSKKLPQVPEIAEGAFGYMDIEPFTVKVQFSHHVATFIAERIWSDDQVIEELDDGGIILTMTARSDIEIVPWVLGYGDNVTVLEPEWLREKIVNIMNNINCLYGK